MLVQYETKFNTELSNSLSFIIRYYSVIVYFSITQSKKQQMLENHSMDVDGL